MISGSFEIDKLDFKTAKVGLTILLDLPQEKRPQTRSNQFQGSTAKQGTWFVLGGFSDNYETSGLRQCSEIAKLDESLQGELTLAQNKPSYMVLVPGTLAPDLPFACLLALLVAERTPTAQLPLPQGSFRKRLCQLRIMLTNAITPQRGHFLR